MKAIARIAGGVGRMGGPSRITPAQLVCRDFGSLYPAPTGKETE